MPHTKKVAVVILSWNGKHFLQQFLPSIVQHTSTDLCEIIIADNGSTDGSIEFLKHNYPTIRVIQNSRNGGYAGGYNDALAQVNTEYFVLLNQDVEVTEQWVEFVLSEMEQDKHIAAAQPKLRAFNDRQSFEYAGAAGGYLDRYGYAFCRGRVFDTIEKDEGQYDNTCDVFWATGACLFVRADVYRKAGGLDEDFFAHQEEIDLCWRLNNLGYRIIAVPKSVVYHVGGGSLPQGNPRKTYLNFRNNLMMMFKNLPLAEMVWKVFFVRLLLDIVAAYDSIRKTKNLADFNAIGKAHLHFFMAIPNLVVKRKRIATKSSAKLSNLSVVWQYFANRKKTYRELS
jgi:GT2 family glycosyltransferase